MNKQNQFDGHQDYFQTDFSQHNTIEDKELSPALPEGWHTPRGKEFKDSVYLSKLVEQRSLLVVRLLGYGLLLFALFDYIYIIIPPHFTNPVWEFQTIGALVEHAAVPMLGLMFVFYRHQGYMKKRERNFLGFLSWISLLMGLLYLLMLPLGVSDTWRIYHHNNTQIAAQASQQHQQVQKFRGKLNQATTDEQLQKLLAPLAPQGRSLDTNPQMLRDKFLAQFSQVEQLIQTKADRVQADQEQTLIKQSVRWNIGALVSGILFIWIWHLTYWTRKGLKLK